MSVTTQHLTDQPVVESAEQKVEAAAPAVVRPEVSAVEKDFNAALDTAEDSGDAEAAELAKAEPGVAAVERDVGTVTHGGAVSPLVAYNDASAVVKEVKAGYKTTEFWLTTAALILTNFSIVKIPGQYGQAITDAGAIAGYVLSRGIAKHAA